MKSKAKQKTFINNMITYAIVVVAYIVVQILMGTGHMSSLMKGLLVPFCIYVIMAVSLNLTVGILGELSLGHAGFMCVGAFAGALFSKCMKGSMNPTVSLIIAVIIGAVVAAVFGILIGIPVLRLKGDYLAIVTLAFGEIIKNIINAVYLGRDGSGFHISLKDSMSLNMDADGEVLIKGAQGITGTPQAATFTIGVILVLITLVQGPKIMDDLIDQENRDYQFLGIKESPRQTAYRNKMEFSFGDEFKDGPLALGMHKRGSFYDIVTVENCQIVDEDFRKILSVTLAYFREQNITYYHKLRHTGYLRHLLVRKAVKTGEILVDLVTTTQTDFQGIAGAQMDEVKSTLNNAQENAFAGTEEELLEGWKAALLAADYKGIMTGILHTRNDNVADTVTNEGTDVLYGQDFFYEELLGLRFKITPFSFFQTNSLGAEVLYQTAREFIGDALPSGTDADIAEHGKIVFDLYSGTGTIAQMLSPVAKKVIGVEIIEEAVEAAKENAQLNGLHNCEFIAGDVLKVIDSIEEKPDYIVLDPPRDGINPKALEKIIRYNVPQMVYISCKPTSLARDLEVLQARGYEVKKVCCVDMFPSTFHVESVVLMQYCGK